MAFPRFAALLSPRGLLAIVHRRVAGAPWQEELRELERRFARESEQPRPNLAAALDQQVRELGRPWSSDGVLQLAVTGSVVWGRPLEHSG